MVWFFTLICMFSGTQECGYTDPVFMPPGQRHQTRQACIEAGKKFAGQMSLPANKWAVVCLEGAILEKGLK